MHTCHTHVTKAWAPPNQPRARPRVSLQLAQLTGAQAIEEPLGDLLRSQQRPSADVIYLAGRLSPHLQMVLLAEVAGHLLVPG